ncbi:Na+/H+ antiporter NhaA [Aliikangiella coralliicola]|uniref:Na(+)/H(+) antiporter NhaA n=1 Tax=Aliikangiella coralliicola TaxID=2592383 RepID=A0A545U6L2_9GAMM|nr:Na+/H+ antiporter NhaA [Aliikangiella coralliicola]TQV85074.1 Na+/H+ antiporter NhaA [Aliikangiella coralliicola]
MKTIEAFFKKESSAGILLIFATILALILKNSHFIDHYESFLHVPVELRLGSLHIDKPLILWVNDGLMAIFFFLIGLEVKREILEGQLSSFDQIALPGFAAVGGMLIPALFYYYFNQGDDFAMRGWAIPTATDIAFALGVLSLLGNRVPLSLKIFLMALAIIDDLGAILIIALFYTVDLSVTSIIIALSSLVILVIMNRLNVAIRAAYIFVGLILWTSVLKSGVHATLAGVALAFTIPIQSTNRSGENFSMLKQTEEQLHTWVAFLILPLFAFVNSGIDLQKISTEQLFSNVSLGIFFGLFFGKQLGVFFFSWIAVKMGIAKLPENSNWLQLYAIAILTGIGFTMSLFVNSLAFADTQVYQSADKLSIIVASFSSGILGYILLRLAKPNH